MVIINPDGTITDSYRAGDFAQSQGIFSTTPQATSPTGPGPGQTTADWWQQQYGTAYPGSIMQSNLERLATGWVGDSNSGHWTWANPQTQYWNPQQYDAQGNWIGGSGTSWTRATTPTTQQTAQTQSNPFQNLDLQSLIGGQGNSYQNWLGGITGNNSSSFDSISNLVSQMNSPSLTKGFGGSSQAPSYDWGYKW